MSGWNIVYGLINFAILAVALYFIGRKLVVKGYRDHREKVERTLARADETVVEAKNLLDAIPDAKAAGERACGEILTAAKAAAEENSRLSREKLAAEEERLAAENDKTLRLARADLRRELGDEAAAGIGEAAAALLTQEIYAPQRAALCERQIDAFAADYRPYPGELECFADEGRARIAVRFAEKTDEAAAKRIERAVAAAVEKSLGRALPTEMTVSWRPS